MKPNTLNTNAASSNGKFADYLAGKHHQAFTLVERRPWSQRFGGFTLIELLVVIAIISLMLGLLVPCLKPARKNVTQTVCNSNLKNLFLALRMYADDNNGRCPNVSDLTQVPLKFKEALQSYVKSEEIFWCPDDPEKLTHPDGSYDWRVTHDPNTSLSGLKLDLLRHPNRVIIAGERSHGCHKPETINVIYADGHVEQVTMEEFLRNITTPLEFL